MTAENKDADDAVEALLQEYEDLRFPAGIVGGRREHDRIRELLPVEFKGPQGEGSGETRDMGLSGFSVVSETPLLENEAYSFSIRIPQTNEIICATGKVVWSAINPNTGKTNAGVEFQEISEEYRKKVALHIQFLKEQRGREPVERRKFLRIPRLLKVILKYGKEEKIKGIITDIGLGGVRVMINKGIQEGSVVTLDIEIEKGKSITLDGKIVWGNQVEALRGSQHGIEFIHGVQYLQASKEIANVIREYIEFQKDEPQSSVLDSLLYRNP